jgi:hypothetical protein
MLDKLVHFINPLIDEIPPNLGESPFSGSPKQVRPTVATRRDSLDVDSVDVFTHNTLVFLMMIPLSPSS